MDFLTSFATAIASNNTNQAVSLAQQTIDVTSVDAHNENALFYLVKSNNIELINQIFPVLIEKGINIDYVNTHQETALFEAVRLGVIEAVKLLLQSKANVNHTNNDKNTVLHVAAENDRVSIISLLLTQEMNINAVNAIGVTPLYRSIEWNSLEATKLLIKAKASVNQRPKGQKSPIGHAALHESFEAIQCLFENGAIVHEEDREALIRCAMLTTNNSYLTDLISINLMVSGTRLSNTLITLTATYLPFLAVNTHLMQALTKMNILDDYTNDRLRLLPILIQFGRAFHRARHTQSKLLSSLLPDIEKCNVISMDTIKNYFFIPTSNQSAIESAKYGIEARTKILNALCARRIPMELLIIIREFIQQFYASDYVKAFYQLDPYITQSTLLAYLQQPEAFEHFYARRFNHNWKTPLFTEESSHLSHERISSSP